MQALTVDQAAAIAVTISYIGRFRLYSTYLSQDTYYLDIEEATVFKRPDNIQNKDEGDKRE